MNLIGGIFDDAWAARAFGRCRALALAGLLAVLGFPPSSLADETPVKGEVNTVVANGFARLVFRFNEEVGSELRLADNIVIIAFKRPVDVPVEGISGVAGDYVAAARRDPDGMGVRLALARKVRVNIMPAGEQLFVDLLPEPWAGVVPGLPQDVVEELARRAREAEKLARQRLIAERLRDEPPLRVKVGKQPTFTRYIFDLPDNVGVANDKTKDQLTLTFDAPLKFDLADAVAEKNPAISSIETKAAADSVSIRFSLAGEADIRSFREDKTYIVDVGNLRKTPAVPDDLAAAMGIKDAGDLGRPAKPVSTPNIEAPPTIPAAAIPGAPASASTVTANPSAKAAPPETAPAKPSAPPQQPAAKSPAAQSTQAPASPPQAQAKPSEAMPSAPGVAEVAAAPHPEPGIEPEPAGDRTLKPPAPPPGALRVTLTRNEDGLRLTFPFTGATPAAAFRRDNYVWAVFDTTAELDLSALDAVASHTIESAALLRSDGAAVLRIKLERPQLVSMIPESSSWTMTLGDAVVQPTQPLALTRNIAGAARSSVIIPFDHPQHLHRLHDPDIGDTLMVVTGLGPARGFLKTQDFVEFRALASIQGVAIQPLADDLTATFSTDKIVIGRPAGLTLSASAYGAAQIEGAGPAVLDPQLWGFDRHADFAKRQSLLLNKAAEAPDSRRKAARLDLARFYLAQGMEAEAKGVLDVELAAARPAAEDAPALVLRAIAEIMMGRSDDALRDLSDPVVGDQYDAPLWRAMAQERSGRYAEARQGFKVMKGAAEALPVELQRSALLAALRSSIEVRDFAEAANQLNEFQTIGAGRDMQPQLAVLSGRLAEGLGRAEEALRAYRNAAEGPDGPAQAEGRLRLAALRYKLGDLKRPEVISELESLTTAWRGDDTEIEALQLMARLYTEEGRYRDAFNVMRTALTAHPNSELTRRIHDEAEATFDSLFLSDKSNAIPPIDALSLFYDFRELTPIGRRGDEMIRRLAERLVTVDLLDQACELLQYQVDHRLQGAARAQVAARLAVVYLMNRKPDHALATLQASRTADLSNELRNQRLLIEARAMSDMGRHDVALEVIANVAGPEAVRLRSDILWAAHRWGAAAEQIELLYGERWRDWKPLDETERSDMLRAAVGFALGDDQIGLARFREKYAAKMADTPERRAFDVVTAPMPANGAEFRDIAKTVSAVDTLLAFLRDLRARYPDGAASDKPSGAPPAAKPAAALEKQAQR